MIFTVFSIYYKHNIMHISELLSLLTVDTKSINFDLVVQKYKIWESLF